MNQETVDRFDAMTAGRNVEAGANVDRHRLTPLPAPDGR
jgi:hypothetical protein